MSPDIQNTDFTVINELEQELFKEPPEVCDFFANRIHSKNKKYF